MPKKKKNKKKGVGEAKTAAKEQKKAAKHLLKETGEEPIENILAELAKEEEKKLAKQTLSISTLSSPPSPRSNGSLVAHPYKPILILFGGEYFDGHKTSVYGDLYLYDISKSDWKLVVSPGSPAPRSSHQSIIIDKDGGQMWIFGGEFTSPSFSQFHHFRDLYCLSLVDYSWHHYNLPHAPSARSGHRMVAYKNEMIILFGGFFDNGVDVSYSQELFILDISILQWRNITKENLNILNLPNKWPSSRSGLTMWVDEINALCYLYGGYTRKKPIKQSKTKNNHPHSADGKSIVRDKSRLVDKWAIEEEEIFLSDLWCLSLSNFTWTNMKKKGIFPAPRTGLTAIGWPIKNKAFLFGGVRDQSKKENKTNNMSGFNNNKQKQTQVTKKNKIQNEGMEEETSSNGEGEEKTSEADIDESLKKKSGKSESSKSENKQKKQADDSNDNKNSNSDEDEDEDDNSVHFNDLFQFNNERGHFSLMNIKGNCITAVESNRNKTSNKSNSSNADENSIEQPSSSTSPRSIFDFDPTEESAAALNDISISSSTVTVALSPSLLPQTADNDSNYMVPSPRRSSLLCISDNNLYLYGGVCESLDGREVIYGDIWSIELNKTGGVAQWKEIVKFNPITEWIDSEKEDEEEEQEEEKEEEEEEEDDDDEQELEGNDAIENPKI